MNVVADGLRRVGFEIRSYFRAPDQVFFTFLFPLVMFALFASIFDGQTVGTMPDGSEGPPMAQYYLTGMLAMAVLLSGTQSLAIDIAIEKHDGGLRRLGATPLHQASFFIGKFGSTLVTCLAQIVLLLAFARLAFGVELPADAEHWTTFAWLVLLGLACFAALGIALSAAPRSSRTASAVVIPVILIPQFVSGIFLPFAALPEWVQSVASVLPLTWFAQGVRSVFLPPELAAAEPAGEWRLGLVALVLAGWLVVGLVISRLTFRWTRGRA